MSEHEERLKLCKELGCSGVNNNCPGNPMCTILRKVIPKKLYTAADLEQARADGLKKLRAFMTGLECENIDQFVEFANEEECLALGKLIKTKTEQVLSDERARSAPLIDALELWLDGAACDDWGEEGIDNPIPSMGKERRDEN